MGGVDALAGERAGRAFSRESGVSHRADRNRGVYQSPARRKPPYTYASASQGNRQILGSPRAEVARGLARTRRSGSGRNKGGILPGMRIVACGKEHTFLHVAQVGRNPRIRHP